MRSTFSERLPPRAFRGGYVASQALRVALSLVILGVSLSSPAHAAKRPSKTAAKPAATRVSDREAAWLIQWLHLLPDGTRVNVSGLRDGRLVITDLQRDRSYALSDLNLTLTPAGAEQRYRLSGRYASAGGAGGFALHGQARDPQPDPTAPTGKRLTISFDGEIRPVLMADVQPYLAIPGAQLFGERFPKAAVHGRTENSTFRETRVTLHGTNAGDFTLTLDGPVNRPRVALPSDSPLGSMLEGLLPTKR